MISLQTYLIIGAILLVLGIYTVVSRRNAVGILMGVELILNSAGLNFVAVSRFVELSIDGQVFTIFIIVLAASEAAVALGIILSYFQTYASVYADRADSLRR
ncbi:MAG: NADH-quinone oxidoreductase subunit NuoK [Candidatus Latescibacteria bacterium]|nr:NADH-quinone oxidoreductase subunit NuoK [Candidatus Latescibacterota bacterium]NIM66390.1 NADH-quinone oxidoreductase subunit NuoK [Candidatus Latescibacterota bacterium]NIO02869.1 NADH-quinone oxidoreductase subunit NuoK [Candidatus Latescibacterota bacterium]NIO30004.1 NADH-quinone oxidoreductase subunit NuoK [Candidatus Latescibacterota bacterium]NIO57619.1 NADH-quinone oxidoreductase subunit NuoK [Candidatus Latescibacterota bacterium]